MDYNQFITAREDITFARSQKDIIEGWVYSTGALFEGVGAGNSKNVWIENPSDSGNYIVATSRYSTSGEFLVKKVDSITIDSSGTNVLINNRLISDGNASTNAEKNVSFSGGNNWTEKVVGSGSNSGATIAGANISDGEILLKEGENVVFQAQNNTNSSLDVTIDVDFFEIPNSEIPEL